MENYIHSLNAASVTLHLCEKMLGGVPRFLENEVTFLQGLTHPQTRVVELSRDLISRIFEREVEPTREMRLPSPVVYLDGAIPIIGRGPSRRKTNLTYHGLLLFEVPQSYLNDKKGFLLPFMKGAYPEAYAGLNDDYGHGDIRIMGYNSEGEDVPGLTRLWLHHAEPPGVMEAALDGYEAAQLRRFVAGFLTLRRGEVAP